MVEKNSEQRRVPASPRRGFIDAEAIIRAASKQDDAYLRDSAQHESIGWSPDSVVGRRSGRHFPTYIAAESMSDSPKQAE